MLDTDNQARKNTHYVHTYRERGVLGERVRIGTGTEEGKVRRRGGK